MIKKLGMTGLALVFALTALSGCSQKTEDDLKTDASNAGTKIKQAASNADKAMTNDETSASVKQALVAAKDLITTDLKVDTKDKTVTLHGSVPTGDQKKRAETIAKNLLGTGYTVVDQLQVNPHA